MITNLTGQMRNIVLFVSLLLLTHCNSDNKTKSKEENDGKKFFEINYENDLKNKATVFLSDIASEVKYIQLETGDKYLISGRPEYYFSDSLIFVANYDQLLVFDYSGKFVRQIGTPGRGPGEIDLITYISILENEKLIIIQTNWSRKLMYFSFDGTFIKSVPRPPDVFRIHVLNKDQFLSYYSCAIGNEEYLYLLSDEKGDTVSTVRNHYKWVNTTGITGMIGYHAFHPFYKYNNQTFFKSMYNDTVYTVSDNKIKPVYFVDLGAFRLPDELRPEPPQSAVRFRSENGKYFFSSVLQAGKTIFIKTQNYKGEGDRNILFDKATLTGNFLTDKSGEPAKFINDWDGGMDFWPVKAVNDNEIFMPITPLELREIIKDEEFDEKTANSPERKQSFKTMAEGLQETDNPVLMVVRLK